MVPFTSLYNVLGKQNKILCVVEWEKKHNSTVVGGVRWQAQGGQSGHGRGRPLLSQHLIS